jgi:hypothetical protein
LFGDLAAQGFGVVCELTPLAASGGLRGASAARAPAMQELLDK